MAANQAKAKAKAATMAKANGKDHAVDVCAETASATTTKTTSVASLPFRFQCFSALELVCFAVIFPPTTLDMRHLTHSLGKLHKYLEELPYQR